MVYLYRVLLIIDKVDKILEKSEDIRHLVSYGIDVELNINQQALLTLLLKTGYKMKFSI